MAFGAPRASILRLIVGRGLRLSALGIAIGLAAAFGLTRILNSMLVGSAGDRSGHVPGHRPALRGDSGAGLLDPGQTGGGDWIPMRRCTQSNR
jgi:ABC-type antimicrobial peptide transport system permease subunit